MRWRLREYRVRLLNLRWRWRHDITHLRVTCERCGQRVWFTPRDWDWTIVSFALYCRTCQREYDRETAAWLGALQAEEEML